MVDLQTAIEDGIGRALGQEDARMVLCHRGSLDPLAYWLDRGWPEEEFFAYTRSRRADHFRRYAAVLHLVTTADGAEESYRRWPKGAPPRNNRVCHPAGRAAAAGLGRTPALSPDRQRWKGLAGQVPPGEGNIGRIISKLSFA